MSDKWVGLLWALGLVLVGVSVILLGQWKNEHQEIHDYLFRQRVLP